MRQVDEVLGLVVACVQAGQKMSFTDKAKAFAVKAIDHTQTALEGAKQNVRP